MSVWLRIALYIVAGWLYGSGYIGEEVKDLITTDPAMAASIEAGISALIASIPIAWWRLAKRLGWKT
ncbi:hypothetical protein NGR_c11450 [Sinorhizobium fredii NGR234]|uniref:Transmembrane protein n=1 Tax=Sinorhizobium fredii (strain NBRC 101917 / NGR234) TaxID=394 RepID=C3MAT7_SINFN|nr:hypothetical protein [Sinorhizobium fredii]ACP24930.1 hypothetical protein NGR_c11450 [Sinorhizobium fredii NGR234]